MKIAAKYAGFCQRCKGAFERNEIIEYNQDTKRVYHPYCVEEPGVAEELDEDKAERLGYKPHA